MSLFHNSDLSEATQKIYENKIKAWLSLGIPNIEMLILDYKKSVNLLNLAENITQSTSNLTGFYMAVIAFIRFNDFPRKRFYLKKWMEMANRCNSYCGIRDVTSWMRSSSRA